MRTLVKLGGRALDDLATLDGLARALASTRGEFILVHGGGHHVSSRLIEAGLEATFVDGLRVTSAAAMPIVEQVLAVEVNGRVTAALEARGLSCVGLSGRSDRLLVAEPKAEGRWGRVGTVVESNSASLEAILTAGRLPVVAPVCAATDGGSLNVNADEVALALAVALRVDRLLLVSDVPGVCDGGAVIDRLNSGVAADLLDRGVITGGMAVKVRQALAAAAVGVDVVIGDANALRGLGGTRVAADAARGVAA